MKYLPSVAAVANQASAFTEGKRVAIVPNQLVLSNIFTGAVVSASRAS